MTCAFMQSRRDAPCSSTAGATSLHIMHVIDTLATGGAERMLVEIANQSQRDGYRVSVCITRAGSKLACDIEPGISIHELGRTSRFDLVGMRRLAAVARSSGVDIFHAHGRSTFSFLAAARTMRLFDLPLLLHDHYGKICIDPSVPMWFRVWGKSFVDRYVGVCDEMTAWAVTAGIPSDRVSVLENAMDIDRLDAAEPLDIRRQFSIQSRTPVGLVVAGLRPEKGLDVLIEAMARISPEIRPIVLVAGGSKDEAYVQQCRKQLERFGLGGSIRLLGERTDTLRLAKSVDFGVHPARSESGPLALIEYAAAGLPFVSSRVGAIANRMAALGIPGFVPAGEAGPLSEGLQQIVALSPEERKRRGGQGRKAALESFNIKSKGRRLYDIYHQMCNVGAA